MTGEGKTIGGSDETLESIHVSPSHASSAEAPLASVAAALGDKAQSNSSDDPRAERATQGDTDDSSDDREIVCISNPPQAEYHGNGFSYYSEYYSQAENVPRQHGSTASAKAEYHGKGYSSARYWQAENVVEEAAEKGKRKGKGCFTSGRGGGHFSTFHAFNAKEGKRKGERKGTSKRGKGGKTKKGKHKDWY